VRNHKFNWGYTWTKVFLQSKGLLVRAKRPPHRIGRVPGRGVGTAGRRAGLAAP
jgi:hypothetical protein